MNRPAVLVAGISAVIGLTWLWHGPVGTGERFASTVESRARAALDRDEMTQVQARLKRDPLTRQLLLSGPADDFQRREIERRMATQPGVADAAWEPHSLEAEAVR